MRFEEFFVVAGSSRDTVQLEDFLKHWLIHRIAILRFEPNRRN